MINLPFLNADSQGGFGHMGGYGGWHDGGMMGWGWGLHSFTSLVLLLLLAAVLVVAVRWIWRAGGSTAGVGAGSGNVLSLLEERYARGDIDRDEFLTRKKDLGG